MKFPWSSKALRFLQISSVLAVGVAHATTIKLDAGNLEDSGTFAVRNAGSLRYLSDIAGTGNFMPAIGAVRLPHRGRWRLFVSLLNFATDAADMRHFTVRLGNQKSSTVFGAHHQSVNREFYSEDGRIFDLPAGPLLTVVGEMNARNANIGQIMFIDEVQASTNVNPSLTLRAVPAQIVPLTVRLDEKTSLKPAAVTLRNLPDTEI